MALPHRALGWGIDGQMIDVGGGTAGGVGFDGVVVLGHGRVGLLGEAGAGGLMLSEPTDAVGAFATVRVGARLLLATWQEDVLGVDLLVDAGVGEGAYWLDGAGLLNRPSAFLGWGTMIHGDHHGFHLELRMSASPRTDDADALRVICRGTCMTPAPTIPADVTLQFLMGVASW